MSPDWSSLVTVMHQGMKSLPHLGETWHLSHLHHPYQAKTKKMSYKIMQISDQKKKNSSAFGTMFPFHCSEKALSNKASSFAIQLELDSWLKRKKHPSGNSLTPIQNDYFLKYRTKQETFQTDLQHPFQIF
jgi:hypothetical protein